MTANVLEHRRARAFADAVDDRPSTAAPQGPSTEGALSEGQFAPMMAAVDALGAVPVPVFDAAVKLTQRAQLMAEFERAFAGGGGAAVPEQRRRGAHRATEAARRFRPNSRWGRRLAVGGLAAGMAMGALGGVAAASSSSVPGDSLYGMKRGLEDWQLNFAGSDEERGRLLLDHATQRMSEAQLLMSHQQPGQALSPHMVAEVSRALTDMNTEGSQGRDLLRAIYQQNHSLAPLRQLADFADSQQQRLAAIEPKLDAQLDPVAGRVESLLSGISADLAPLHLTPAPSVSDSTSAQPSGDGSASATGGADGSVQGTGSTPQGGTTTGTGTLHGNAPGASPTGGGNGALVGGLTGGLLGSNSTPSSTPSAGTSAGAGGGSPSATPGGGNGVTVPPLIPGLLPSIGIGLIGG